jgi:hypothetical protein
MKPRQRLDRAPSGEKARQDQKLIATTVFDFAWRMRTRSNYDDPAMFYSGTLDYKRARAYADAIRTWTRATMFLFAALIAHRSMNVLRDAALHFSQLDRSNMAKTLIFPGCRPLRCSTDRLGMLGLFKGGLWFTILDERRVMNSGTQRAPHGSPHNREPQCERRTRSGA